MKTLQSLKEETSIRWLVRRDLKQVLPIDEASFHEDDRWGEQDFNKALKGRNSIGMVLEIGDDILGYVIYNYNDKNLEILRIAVKPSNRRQGVGRQIIEKLVSKLEHYRRRELGIWVSEDDLKTHLWLKSCDFFCDSIEKGMNHGRDFYHFQILAPFKPKRR